MYDTAYDSPFNIAKMSPDAADLHCIGAGGKKLKIKPLKKKVSKRIKKVGDLVYRTVVRPGLSYEHGAAGKKIPALRSRTTVWNTKSKDHVGEYNSERNLKNPFSTQVYSASTGPEYRRKGVATEALRQQSRALGARKIRHSSTLSNDGKAFASARATLPKRAQKQTRASRAERAQVKAWAVGRKTKWDAKINDPLIQAKAEKVAAKYGLTPGMTPRQRVARIMEVQNSG